MSDLPQIVAGLVIRPGDTLIVATGQSPMSREVVERFRAYAKENLPGIADCVVIGGVVALAAYRPVGDDE